MGARGARSREGVTAAGRTKIPHSSVSLLDVWGDNVCMRFLRTLSRCVCVGVVVSALALLAPAHAGAESTYGPKVETALAELAPTAQAGVAEAEGRRGG